MQNNSLTAQKFHTSPFYEDIAILLDIYQDGDTLLDMMPKISKTTCSPTSPAYPLEWVATEILQPQVLDFGAGALLKKLCQYLPVKNFRQMIRCLAILSNDTLKEFMVSVVLDLKIKGRDALLAKQVYDFADDRLTVDRGYVRYGCDREASVEPRVNLNSNGVVLYNDESIKLTRMILTALHEYQIIKPAKTHQNSKMLAYSFDEIDLYDSTVVFLMYWLREQGYSANSAVDHEMWPCFGLTKKVLTKRLNSTPLDNFFLNNNPLTNDFSYKYCNTNEAFNRLKAMSS